MQRKVKGEYKNLGVQTGTRASSAIKQNTKRTTRRRIGIRENTLIERFHAPYTVQIEDDRKQRKLF